MLGGGLRDIVGVEGWQDFIPSAVFISQLHIDDPVRLFVQTRALEQNRGCNPNMMTDFHSTWKTKK